MYKEIMDDTQEIQQDRAHKMRKDVSNYMFIRLMCMLMPFLIYSVSLHCAQPVHNVCGQGQAWKCNNCRQYQWQASNCKSWDGSYHCTICGAKR